MWNQFLKNKEGVPAGWPSGSSCAPKGCRVDSPLGRGPRLQVQSPVRPCTGRGNRLMFLSHIDVFLYLPSTLSKINNKKYPWAWLKIKLNKWINKQTGIYTYLVSVYTRKNNFERKWPFKKYPWFSLGTKSLLKNSNNKSYLPNQKMI